MEALVRVQIEDPEGIERIIDELAAQGFFDGVDRPEVATVYIGWERKERT